MNKDNESKTKPAYKEALTQLELRARNAGCSLDVDFEITSGEINDEGFTEERGSFVATFIPDPSLDVNRRYDAFYNDILELEITPEDVDQLDAMLEEFAALNDKVDEETIKKNNELLNSWHTIQHDYNDDFTITWECDGVEIQCAQEDLNKFEEKHALDAKEIISELVEQINKDARVAAFDRAKIDLDTL